MSNIIDNINNLIEEVGVDKVRELEQKQDMMGDQLDKKYKFKIDMEKEKQKLKEKQDRQMEANRTKKF
jgi:hypothetical protein